MRHRNDCESGEYSPSVSERGFSFGVPREDGGTVSSLGRTFQGRCNVSMMHRMVRPVRVGGDADGARTARPPCRQYSQITTRRSAPEQEHKNPPRTLHRNRNTTRTNPPSVHGCPCPSSFEARWAEKSHQAASGRFTGVSRVSSGSHNTRRAKKVSRWYASPQPLDRVGVPRMGSEEG